VCYLPTYWVGDEPWLKAPVLQVTVREPEGREKQALALFRGKAQGEFLHMWDMAALGPPPEFAQLARKYPDTVYGRYARFFRAASIVGFDWAEARRTFAAELVGLDRGKAEMRLLEKVSEKRASEFADLARSEPPFPLADQCLLYQAECYLNSRANRRTEAVKVLRDLVAKYPESPVAVKAKKRLEKLGTKAPAPTTSPPSP